MEPASAPRPRTWSNAAARRPDDPLRARVQARSAPCQRAKTRRVANGKSCAPRHTNSHVRLTTDYSSAHIPLARFGNHKYKWSLLPLRVRGLGQMRLHADLTILSVLASRLAQHRANALKLAA